MTRVVRLIARMDAAETRALKVLRDDLRLAANKTMSRLWLGEVAEGEPQQTAAYRIMVGAGEREPAYVPTTEGRASGGVISAVATHVHQRLRTDRRDIEGGRKSLATFRRLPICFRRQEVAVLDHERMEFLVYGRPNVRRVEVRVKPVGKRYRETWRRIVAREIQHGDARLQLDRKGRWYVLLSHEIRPVAADPRGPVVGVELAGASGVRCRWEDQEEVFPIPANFWRLWVRELEFYRTMGKTARLDYGLREGRGRARKLRPQEKRRQKYLARTDDARKVLAAAVVRHALKLGASAILLPHVTGEVQGQQDETEDVHPRETRAELRSRFLRRHRTAIWQQIASAAEREGLRVVVGKRGKSLDEGLKETHAVLSAESLAAEGASGQSPCPEGERGEGCPASGDVVAESPEALERSPRSRVTTRDRSGSRGLENAHDQGSRSLRRKRRKGR